MEHLVATPTLISERTGTVGGNRQLIGDIDEKLAFATIPE